MADISLSKPTEEDLALLANPTHRSGVYAKAIQQFVESGEAVAVAYRNGDAQAARNAAICLQTNIRRLALSEQIRAQARGAVVFLVRKDLPRG